MLVAAACAWLEMVMAMLILLMTPAAWSAVLAVSGAWVEVSVTTSEMVAADVQPQEAVHIVRPTRAWGHVQGRRHTPLSANSTVVYGTDGGVGAPGGSVLYCVRVSAEGRSRHCVWSLRLELEVGMAGFAPA
jgi:hypothetical protein